MKETSKITIKKKTFLKIAVALLAIVVILLLLKKSPMAEQGDSVLVDYVGMFENNTVFDTSNEVVAKEAGIYNPQRQYKPLQVLLGAGQVIPGFEDAIIGMELGQEKTVNIPPIRAYGDYDSSKLFAVNRSVIGEENIVAGSVLAASNGAQFKVIQVNSTSVILDGNHPLAGKTLVFRIKLVKITK